MNELTVKTNLPDFKAQMKELGYDFERRVFRAGVGAAAQVFRREVQRRAPVRTGLLSRAVYVKRDRSSGRGKEHYFVGIRQGKRARSATVGKGFTGNLDAYYWRFVEAGHLVRQPGGRLRGGTRTRALQRSRLIAGGAKRVPGKGFIRTAFEAKKGEALDAFTARVQRRIDKENAKR